MGKSCGGIMSQIQQLYRERLKEQPVSVSEKDLQRYEAALLSELFRRNGRTDIVLRATPPGYGYERVEALPPGIVDASGPVMQIAAHPGDGPDFFYATALQMAAHAGSHQYYELLLTDGERGVDGWEPERTRRVRAREAYAGAEMVGSTLRFLGYPDGGLASLAEHARRQLIAELAGLIKSIQPALLVAHPPKNDHPDHASAFFLTLAALELNVQAGGRAPALYVHDVEFGLQQECLWASHTLDSHIHTYPMHVPDFLVDISATHQIAQQALHRHQTQMYDSVLGQPKIYADLIDTLARVRGLQFLSEGTAQLPRGQAFSQIVIPGLTSPHNILPLRLPAGSVYQKTNLRAKHEGSEIRAEESCALSSFVYVGCW